MDIRPFAADLF